MNPAEERKQELNETIIVSADESSGSAANSELALLTISQIVRSTDYVDALSQEIVVAPLSPVAEKQKEVPPKEEISGKGAPESGLNRRSFLSALTLDTVTIAATIPLLPNPLSWFSRETDHVETEGYPYTNKDIAFDEKTVFRNIGVRHTSEDFLKDREYLIRAIQDHDVVMVEGFSGQAYFDFVAAIAHHEGKELIRLESDIPVSANVTVGIVPFVSLYAGLKNLEHYLIRGLRSLSEWAAKSSPVDETQASQSGDGATKLSQTLKPTYRRTAFTLLAYGLSRVFGISVDDRTPKTAEGYPANDNSHTVDGRTVLMLDEVRTYLKAHPGKSAAVITGDMHARGFNYYTDTAEGRESFEQKVAYYNLAYKPILGGNAKVEEDPAKKNNASP